VPGTGKGDIYELADLAGGQVVRLQFIESEQKDAGPVKPLGAGDVGYADPLRGYVKGALRPVVFRHPVGDDALDSRFSIMSSGMEIPLISWGGFRPSAAVVFRPAQLEPEPGRKHFRELPVETPARAVAANIRTQARIVAEEDPVRINYMIRPQGTHRTGARPWW